MSAKTGTRGLVRGWFVAGGLFLLLAALLAVAPALVDRDALRERLQAEASQALGLPVQVAAVSELSLLPRPRIVLGSVLILSREGPAATPLVAAESLRLDLALWPLLLGRAEPALLQASGIDSRLPGAVVTATLWPWATAPALEVRDAELTLDYPAGARRLGWRLFEKPTPVLQAAGTGPLAIAAVLPMEVAHAPVAGTLTLAAQADISNLPMLTLAPLRLAGTDLRLGELRELAPVLTAERAVRDADGAWRFTGAALSEGSFDVRGDISLAPAPATAALAGSTASGSLTLAPLDLRRWLARHLGRPLPGHSDRLRCVAAVGDFRLRGDQLEVAPLAARVDASHARAAGRFQLGPIPRGAAALRLDGLDLDPYLSASDAAAADDPAASCAPGADVAAHSLPQPDTPALPTTGTDPDLVLDLRADVLGLGGLSFGELSVAAARHGAHGVADIAADAFYAGALTARIEQTLRPALPPQQRLWAAVSGADLGAILADVQGEPQVSGRLDLSAELAAAGNAFAALRDDLSGTIRLHLQAGRLPALDRAATSFGPLLAIIGLEATPDIFAVSALSLSAEGRNGVFRSRDIDGRARLFTLTGAGNLDLPAGSLSADLISTLVQPPDGPDLKGLAGIEVPIRVDGPMVAPKLDVQIGPAVAEAARRVARRRLDRDSNMLQQLEDATGVPGLEEGLRNLLGL